MPAAPRFSRRRLLRAAAPGGLRGLRLRPEAGPAGDVLVLIFLRGGMDGLHVVPAYGDPFLRRSRPTLAPPDPGRRNGILDLDGFFGLHPGLAPLHDLFQERCLAVVHAAGSPDRTLSHSEAMQTAERGVADGGTTATGWIARHLATRETGRLSPMRAVAIADTLPDSMQGALGATAVRSVEEYRLRVPDAWRGGFEGALTALYAGGEDPVRVSGRGVVRLAGALERLARSPYAPAGGARYPEGPLGRGLREVARLIRAEVGLEVAEVDLVGWDSHVLQIPLMAGLMEELSGGLRAFYQDLGDRVRRVTVVAMSEFGRRVHENAGAGTDHGRGTAMFLLGGGIQGGKVYGRWPGLGPGLQDGDGNLAVTTDFRDVLAEVVERRLRNPRVEAVFPGFRPRYPGAAAPA